eukprot:4171849-Pyramimonas_sp.AAC.1
MFHITTEAYTCVEMNPAPTSSDIGGDIGHVARVDLAPDTAKCNASEKITLPSRAGGQCHHDGQL